MPLQDNLVVRVVGGADALGGKSWRCLPIDILGWRYALKGCSSMNARKCFINSSGIFA